MSASIFILVPPRIGTRDRVVRVNSPRDWQECSKHDYDAPPSLVASVNEAINNGKLKERLLYWADHFDADWADDLAPAAGPANNAMTQLNSGLHGKVGSIEKWLLIVIVVLGAVCLLCCVCCIIHVGTCGIL